jgi:PAS domain S-box-containing protein
MEHKGDSLIEHQDAMVEAAQRLAAIVESSDDAIVSKDLNGIVKSWNRAAERIFGFTADEAIGRSITIVIPPELQDQEPEILARIGRGERIQRFETVRQRKDGTRFHVSLTISPVRDLQGRIVGASKIARDISDLRQSQDRQELLLREMNHRVKNLFAVASGVVALSSRSATDVKELARTIQSRLSALSRAHELILPQGSSSPITDLSELVRTIVAPYDINGQLVEIYGPEVSCGPSAATSFALLLHEFATNAVKYGALADAGTVEVNWTLSGNMLNFEWSEQNAHNRNGHDEAPGFGSTLVETTAKAMDAQINREWSGSNLTITVRLPLTKLEH